MGLVTDMVRPTSSQKLGEVTSESVLTRPLVAPYTRVDVSREFGQ